MTCSGSDGWRLAAGPSLQGWERACFLGPNAVLVRSSAARGGDFLDSARTPDSGAGRWVVELYEEDEEPIRVLIAGGEE